MKKSYYVIAGIVVVLIAVAVFVYARGNSNQAVPAGEESQPSAVEENTSPAGASSTNEVAGVVVTYTDSGFSPATVNVSKGTTVTFKNQSSANFWPASDPHPTHTNYPGFDAKKAIAPGSSYSFTFTKVGSWGYHNHFSPELKGRVIVQ